MYHLVNNFGNSFVIIRFNNNTYSRIEKIDILYKEDDYYYSKYFSLGYIMSKKHTLTTGFPSKTNIEEVKLATEAMFEAACIFNSSITYKELFDMGYKHTENIYFN